MRSTLVIGLLLVPWTSLGGPVVGPGLEAFVTFEEGAGVQAADATGHGHAVKLSGTAGWTKGAATVVGDASLLRMDSTAALRGGSFTYDLWLEVTASAGDGRLLTQCGKVGDSGPDVLERSGQTIAVRITDRGNATFDVPTVGTRSNSGGADHYGKCADSFHLSKGPEHLIMTHDGGKKLVRLFLGLAGQPIKLCFEATYSGKYVVGTDAITLGNMADASRGLPSRHYQFAYYTRPLDFMADSQQRVVGGEVLANHQAGPSASLPLPPDMSAPLDLAVQPDATAPPDLASPPDAVLPTDATSTSPDLTAPAEHDLAPTSDLGAPLLDAASPDVVRPFRDLSTKGDVDGGCSCSVARRSQQPGLVISLLLVGAVIGRLARRRRRGLIRPE